LFLKITLLNLREKFNFRKEKELKTDKEKNKVGELPRVSDETLAMIPPPCHREPSISEMW
jgi:hypothetical protein